MRREKDGSTTKKDGTQFGTKKKKAALWALLLLLLSSLALAGCGDKDDEEGSRNRKDRDQAEDSEDDEEEDDEKNAKDDGEEELQILDGEGELANSEDYDNADLSAYGDDFDFFGYNAGDTIYAVDTEGNMLASFDKAEIIEQFDLPEEVFFVDHQATVLFVIDPANEESKETYTVYACDLETMEKSVVLDEEYSIQSVEVWDGNLYVDVMDYNYDTGDRVLKEYCFERQGEEGASYEETESPADEMLNQAAADGYDRELTSCFRGYYYYQCAARELGEEGGILLKNNDGFYLMNEAGTYEKVNQLPNSDTVTGRYLDNIVYYIYDDNYQIDGLFLYNICQESSVALTDYFDGFLGIFNGQIYWATNYNNARAELREYHIFAYDMDSEAVTELYEVDSQPGYGYDVDFAYMGFSRVNDLAAVYLPSGNAITWHIIDPSNHYLAEDTGRVVFTPVQEGYGTIESYDETDICDDCGAMISEFYYEVLKLDLEEAGVNSINEQLAGFCEERREYFDSTKGEVVGVSCEEHNENMWYYSYTTFVRGIERVADHYIAIEIDGYEYSGGAHGYPIDQNYLFDLNTGDLVTVADLYSGSEEELADLVAGKAKEMVEEANAAGEYTGFYSDDPDEVYEAALECFSVDMYTRFEEDGVVFAYEPYAVGAYASGYIEVFVSYDDLGFTL